MKVIILSARAATKVYVEAGNDASYMNFNEQAGSKAACLYLSINAIPEPFPFPKGANQVQNCT